MSSNDKWDLDDFCKKCGTALWDCGIPPDRCIAIYNQAIVPFGGELSSLINRAFLIPSAVRAVAGDGFDAAMADLGGYMGSNYKAHLTAYRNHCAWLLSEEVIAMQGVIDGEIDDPSDGEWRVGPNTRELINWVTDGLPQIAGPEQTQYFWDGEPADGVRRYLDNAKGLVRAAAIRTRQALDQQPLCLLDQGIVSAMKAFPFTPPSGFPQCDAPILPCLCCLRFCLYLIYTINDAGVELGEGGTCYDSRL